MSTFGGFGTSSDHISGTNDAAAGLLDLSQGIEGGAAIKRLGNVLLDPERVQELFDEYFRYYHPFLVFIDKQSPQQFYEASPLLFWTIISIAARHFKKDPELLARLNDPLTRLVWDTAAQVPQSHHVVKALCLLCMWPLPVTTTSKDPTLQLCGLMMSMAKQIGLHRPTHAQDFARFSVHLKDEDIRDRMKTWAVCNIVAQNVSTGYGQPADTLYDSTLFPPARTPDRMNPSYPTSALEEQLEIALFCNDITSQLYSSPSHTLDFAHDERRSATANMLAGQFNKLVADQFIGRADGGDLHNSLYLYAANLHLCLSALFQPSNSKTYRRDLLSLWFAVESFLQRAIAFQRSSDDATSIPAVAYFPNYLMQMILAAGYTLLRLLDSFFAASIDQVEGRHLLLTAITLVRQMSVRSNDLPQRMAEVLAQMWKASQSGWLKGVNSTRRSVSPQASHHTPRTNQSSPVSTFHASPLFTPLNRPGRTKTSAVPAAVLEEPDDTLQLQVRYRMSMSVVYDSVLLWREEVQGKVRAEELDKAVKDPTRLEVSGKNTPAPDGAFTAAGAAAAAGSGSVSGGLTAFQFDGMPGNGGVSGLFGGSGLETGMELHDVFDPFPFVLDGMENFVPFPLGMGE
ncbi:hypothetical protein H2199_008086 [Coniosporium tulheliwenetii]|nr:hypothetical protein H2199_008086 [Cladosporium sp. JES 115]